MGVRRDHDRVRPGVWSSKVFAAQSVVLQANPRHPKIDRHGRTADRGVGQLLAVPGWYSIGLVVVTARSPVLVAIWMVEQNLADTRDNDTDQMFSNVGTFSKSHAAYRSPTAVQRALMTRRTASRKVHRVHLFMATDTGVLPWSPSENVVQDSASDVADSSALGHACRHPVTTLSRIRPHEMTSVMLAAVV
ncbi:hypothetical protein ACFSUH_07580 [Rhodococcus jostii]|uniref:hypothetical protein n=2 Tax=Rhodococcus jostii TaxID=132919 RepID=UPI0009327B06